MDPAEVARLLEVMPDLRPALAAYTPEEIGDLVDAFDVKIYFNSIERTIRFELTLAAKLVQAGAKRGKPVRFHATHRADRLRTVAVAA